MRTALAAVLALAGVLGAGGPAAAERLVASLTNHHVMITSNYTGVELVLFGSVEQDATSLGRHGPYDIVATITGPRKSVRTRRKQRVLGIWVNTQARTFVDPPSYLAVLAEPSARRHHQRRQLAADAAWHRQYAAAGIDPQRYRRGQQRSVPCRAACG